MSRVFTGAFAAAAVVLAQNCPAPPPAADFDFNDFTTGVWYEIGKIQTWGGAIFEKNCVCTTLTVTAQNDGYTYDASALNSCRNLSPSGQYINATGSLQNATAPGHWQETFYPGVPGVNYTVIAQGQDYAMTYDCGSSWLGINYCVHVLSRAPVMNDTLFAQLITAANGMGLNLQGLAPNHTLQAGCW